MFARESNSSTVTYLGTFRPLVAGMQPGGKSRRQEGRSPCARQQLAAGQGTSGTGGLVLHCSGSHQFSRWFILGAYDPVFMMGSNMHHGAEENHFMNLCFVSWRQYSPSVDYDQILHPEENSPVSPHHDKTYPCLPPFEINSFPNIQSCLLLTFDSSSRGC